MPPPQPQRRCLPITQAAQGQPPPSGGQRWLRKAAATERWGAGGDLGRGRGGDRGGGGRGGEKAARGPQPPPRGPSRAGGPASVLAVPGGAGRRAVEKAV